MGQTPPLPAAANHFRLAVWILDSAEQQIDLTTDATDLHGYKKNPGRNPELNPSTSKVRSYGIVFD